MSDTEKERIARTEATLDALEKNAERRIGKLEANQRWGVLALISMAFNALYEFFKNGGGQ